MVRLLAALMALTITPQYDLVVYYEENEYTLEIEMNSYSYETIDQGIEIVEPEPSQNTNIHKRFVSPKIPCILLNWWEC